MIATEATPGVPISEWLGRWLRSNPDLILQQSPGRSRDVKYFAAINKRGTGVACFWGIGKTPEEAMQKLEEVLNRKAP